MAYTKGQIIKFSIDGSKELIPLSGGIIDVSEGKTIYYADIISGSVTNLTLSGTKIYGSMATVRIKGDLMGTIPAGWNFSGKPITYNAAKVNELTLLYISDNDVRIVNRIVDFADVTPPSVPENLASSAITPNSFTLDWDASTDNVAVAGYKIYKDNVYLQTEATNTAFISGLIAETSYSFTVTAFDNNANESAQSVAKVVVTLEESNVTPEYTAMLNYATSNGFTLPSAPQQVIDNQKIQDMKDAGIWDELDTCHIFNNTYTPTAWADNFYRINWKDPSMFLLNADSGLDPEWVSGRGFKSIGLSGKFIKTGFIPSVDAVKFQPNDGSIIIGVFDVPTTFDVNPSLWYGGRGTPSNTPQNYLMNSANNQILARMSFGPLATYTISQLDVNGHYHRARRTGLDKCYYNGSTDLVYTGATSSTLSLSSVEPYILGFNDNGVLSKTRADAGVKYLIHGSALDTKKVDIYNILA